MGVDTGDFPVTYCPSGIAAGIDPVIRVRGSMIVRYFSMAYDSPDVNREMKALRALAKAKIAQAIQDAQVVARKNEAAYNRTMARNFLNSRELDLWCEMADIDVGVLRVRLKIILKL